MGKKSKNQQPNAPDLQQILLDSPTGHQQPPHNPYYQDLSSHFVTQNQQPPPPYSDLSGSVPMSRPGQAQLSNNYPRQQPISPTVIVQHPPRLANPYNHRKEIRHQKIRKFNNEMAVAAILCVIFSAYAYSLFEHRPCINTMVEKHGEARMNVFDVRDAQVTIAYFGLFILLISLIKCATGKNNSYCCYLFIVAIASGFFSIVTGFAAYYAFYTPCVLSAKELINNTVKTIAGSFLENVWAGKEMFGESNVLELAREDKAGVIIFFIDVFNFLIYCSLFITSICLC